jgi:hypothetical protein
LLKEIGVVFNIEEDADEFLINNNKIKLILYFDSIEEELINKTQGIELK